MITNPLSCIEKNDPDLYGLISSARELALNDGALPRKMKLLIALALDAAHGATDGVESLAKQALDAGASKNEILDALRVTCYISGVAGVYTAARALKDIL